MTRISIVCTCLGTAATLILCAGVAQAGSLKLTHSAQPDGFKSNGAGQTQQVQQGCEDDVTQTSYMGPCEKHDTIVIEGCHNNVTQTSTPGRCPEG